VKPAPKWSAKMGCVIYPVYAPSGKLVWVTIPERE
jgi:hypothetical protein